MEKVLVIILGQARAHRLTWESFQKNVLHELQADLALCVGTSLENNPENPFWENALYKWVCPEWEDFGDGFDDLQKKRYGSTREWREILTVKNQWLGGIKGQESHPGSAGILIYFRAVLYDALNSEGLLGKYDRFIITRSDFVWALPHPDLSQMNPENFWVPYGEFYYGITDRHAVLSRQFVKPYLDLIEPILRHPEKLKERMLKSNPKQNWNLEQYILFSMREAGLQKKLKYFPYIMYSVRDENTQSRWSMGEFDSSLGYYVKYSHEKTRSELSARFFTDRNGKVKMFNNFWMRIALKILFSLRVRGWI